MTSYWKMALFLSVSSITVLHAGSARTNSKWLTYYQPPRSQPVQQLRLSQPVRSQRSTVHLGLEGGINMGKTAITQSGAAVSSAADRQSFAGGVFMDFDLSRSFAISPELLYLPKGVTVGSGTSATDYRFDTLEIPVLAKVRLGTEGFRPVIFFGPSVGFALSKKSTDSAGTATSIDNGSPIDLSAQVGAGAEIDIARNASIVVSGRYIHGLLDQTPRADQTIFNRTLVILTGLRFGL